MLDGEFKVMGMAPYGILICMTSHVWPSLKGELVINTDTPTWWAYVAIKKGQRLLLSPKLISGWAET